MFDWWNNIDCKFLQKFLLIQLLVFYVGENYWMSRPKRVEGDGGGTKKFVDYVFGESYGRDPLGFEFSIFGCKKTKVWTYWTFFDVEFGKHSSNN